MKEFFATSPVLAWSIVSVMVALLAVSILWTKIKWWWHNTWYSFPLIGKIASLSRDTNRDSTDPAWFKAEKTLCRDYKKFIQIQDEHDFNEKVTYLTKAGDNGRSGTPGLVWVLTVALVFFEAMGFSYVLAGYTVPGGSENVQQSNALGIAFMLSIILIGFTHFAGHELYKSNKIQGARKEWSEAGRKGKTSTGPIPLNDPQSIDGDQPGYARLMNRVGTKPSYILCVITTILVVVVAIGATYVRGQALEKQLLQQVVGQNDGGTELTAKLSKDGLDMSVKETRTGIKLPAADAAESQRASDKAQAEDISIDRHGGWGTFIVLAFIFVFLQIFSLFFGYHWGFAGRESKAAYVSIGNGRYATYADVREHYKDIADTAQSKLEHLQQKLMNRNANSGTDGLHTTKTFYEFMDRERTRETAHRRKNVSENAQRIDMERAQAANPYERMPMTAPTTVHISKQTESTLDTAMHELAKLGQDKEAKKIYIQNLPDSLKIQVMQSLKVQKDHAADKARERDKELDDLLG